MSATPPSSPRVSVVMPAWNAARWLGRALASLVTQTFADIEIIVVDDGSEDATPEIVSAFAARDARVILVRQDHAGFSAAANRGVAEARGEYIGRLDADDVALPDRFAKQVAFMDAHPEVGVVGGSMIVIDENDRKLHRMPYPTENVDTEMLKYSALAHPATLIRRSLMAELGGYRRAFVHAEDYDLWLRIAERARLANLPDAVTYYRGHAGQISVAHSRSQQGSASVAREIAYMRRSGKPDLVTDDTILDADSVGGLGIADRLIPGIRHYFE